MVSEATDADEKWPFSRPIDQPNGVSMFIQWKGTDLCVDFTCRCGVWGHFDGYFAYAIQCPRCDTVYEMATQVLVKVVDVTAPPVVVVLDVI